MAAAGRPIVYSAHWSDHIATTTLTGVANMWRTTSDGWTDPNVGGFTYDENKTHFSLWCLSAAPLIIGTDVSDLKASSLEVLTNAEVIAVDQDFLGYQGRRIKSIVGTSCEVWSKNLKNGDKAVLLVNFSTTPKAITAKWSDIVISGTATVRDLWTHTDKGTIHDSLVAPDIPAHGCTMFRIKGSSVGVKP